MIRNPDSSIEHQELHEIEANGRKLDQLLAIGDCILKQLKPLPAILAALKELIADEAPEPATSSIANVFTGDTIMANNALVFNVGQTAIDTITPLLADGVTPSGGVVSAVTVTFSDPSASFVLNPDNTVTFTGVAASTAPVSGSVACTVTDSDSAVSQWTQAFTVMTNAVTPPPPDQLTQSISNVFSMPTP